MVPFEEHKHEIDEKIIEDIDHGSDADLIVFNDDINTFDWVIQCFVEVCRLTLEEATEKTLYIHYNGHGIVRSGPYQEMVKMKDQLLDRGLTAIVGRAREN